MIALFMASLEVPTRQLISSVMLIALGTAIASYGEINFNLVGVLCMLASESFEATRLVMTQVVLVGLKFNAGKGSVAEASHYQVWKHYLNASKAHANELQHLIAHCALITGYRICQHVFATRLKAAS